MYANKIHLLSIPSKLLSVRYRENGCPSTFANIESLQVYIELQHEIAASVFLKRYVQVLGTFTFFT